LRTTSNGTLKIEAQFDGSPIAGPRLTAVPITVAIGLGSLSHSGRDTETKTY